MTSSRDPTLKKEVILQESFADERLAIRKIAFRNANWNPARTRLGAEELDNNKQSRDMMPKWLVGSSFMLVPAIFDIGYWEPHDSQTHWFGGAEEEAELVHRKHKPFTYLEECLNMIVQIDFEGAGEVSFRSNLLSRRAWEEWQKVHGKVERLNPRKIRQVLSHEWRSRWWSTIKSTLTGRSNPLPASANIIQTSIMAMLPLGSYRGVAESQRRLYIHQTGLDRIQTVDPITLQPSKQHQVLDLLSYHDLSPELLGIPCPNPILDPTTGQLINVLVEYHGAGKWADYRIISITQNNSGKSFTLEDEIEEVAILARFQAQPIKLTTFAMSSNYIVVPIPPLQYRHRIPNFGKANIVSGVDDYLEFFPGEDTLIYVIGRKEGRLVAVYRSEAAAIVTAINVFEEGDSLYLDVLAGEIPEGPIQLTDLRGTGNLDGWSMGEMSGRRLRRYALPSFAEEMARFDGAAGQLRRFPVAPYHLMSEYEVWNPTISSSMQGRPYKFIYATAIDRENRGRPGFPLPTAIVKCDLENLLRSMQWHRRGTFVSPPLFVPRGEGTMVIPMGSTMTSSPTSSLLEDDGILLTLTIDTQTGHGHVMILDASDLRELGRYRLPQAISPALSTPVWLPTLPTAMSMVEVRIPRLTTSTISPSTTMGIPGIMTEAGPSTVIGPTAMATGV